MAYRRNAALTSAKARVQRPAAKSNADPAIQWSRSRYWRRHVEDVPCALHLGGTGEGIFLVHACERLATPLRFTGMSREVQRVDAQDVAGAVAER
jgi:hypothetical protein